jgi:hypothetical protein
MHERAGREKRNATGGGTSSRKKLVARIQDPP